MVIEKDIRLLFGDIPFTTAKTSAKSSGRWRTTTTTASPEIGRRRADGSIVDSPRQLRLNKEGRRNDRKEQQQQQQEQQRRPVTKTPASKIKSRNNWMQKLSDILEQYLSKKDFYDGDPDEFANDATLHYYDSEAPASRFTFVSDKSSGRPATPSGSGLSAPSLVPLFLLVLLIIIITLLILLLLVSFICGRLRNKQLIELRYRYCCCFCCCCCHKCKRLRRAANSPEMAGNHQPTKKSQYDDATRISRYKSGSLTGWMMPATAICLESVDESRADNSFIFQRIPSSRLPQIRINDAASGASFSAGDSLIMPSTPLMLVSTAASAAADNNDGEADSGDRQHVITSSLLSSSERQPSSHQRQPPPPPLTLQRPRCSVVSALTSGGCAYFEEDGAGKRFSFGAISTATTTFGTPSSLCSVFRHPSSALLSARSSSSSSSGLIGDKASGGGGCGGKKQQQHRDCYGYYYNQCGEFIGGAAALCPPTSQRHPYRYSSASAAVAGDDREATGGGCDGGSDGSANNLRKRSVFEVIWQRLSLSSLTGPGNHYRAKRSGRKCSSRSGYRTDCRQPREQLQPYARDARHNSAVSALSSTSSSAGDSATLYYHRHSAAIQPTSPHSVFTVTPPASAALVASTWCTCDAKRREAFGGSDYCCRQRLNAAYRSQQQLLLTRRRRPASARPDLAATTVVTNRVAAGGSNAATFYSTVFGDDTAAATNTLAAVKTGQRSSSHYHLPAAAVGSANGSTHTTVKHNGGGGGSAQSDMMMCLLSPTGRNGVPLNGNAVELSRNGGSRGVFRFSTRLHSYSSGGGGAERNGNEYHVEDDMEIDNRSVLHYELGFYEKTFATNCFRGTLTFQLRYDFIHRVLMLHVMKANHLPSPEDPPDPYIKMYCLPERRHHCKTRIFKKCCDAEFNEMFSFDVPYNQMANRMLQFTVYDFDRFTRHGLIGNVIMRDLFDKSDLYHWTEYTMQIVGSQEKNDFGDLLLYLAYSLTYKKLLITVAKAYNLRPMDITGASDPYVRIEQIYQRRRVKLRKTSIKRANLNPVYHECLEFDLPPEQIDETNMLVQIMDWDRIGRDDLLGCCVLGKESPTKEGRRQWEQTFQQYPQLGACHTATKTEKNNNNNNNDAMEPNKNLCSDSTNNNSNPDNAESNNNNNKVMNGNNSDADMIAVAVGAKDDGGVGVPKVTLADVSEPAEVCSPVDENGTPKPIGTWHSILGEVPEGFRNIPKARK